jgi:predicted transcriptional regulator
MREKTYQYSPWWIEVAAQAVKGIPHSKIAESLRKTQSEIDRIVGPQKPKLDGKSPEDRMKEMGSLGRVAYALRDGYWMLRKAHYYDWLGERVRGPRMKYAISKQEELVKRGFYVRSVPFGYDRDPTKPHTIRPHPQNGPKIRRVYERVAAGEHLREACRNQGIPPIHYIHHSVFRSRIYLGYSHSKGEWYNTHPALISENLWRMAIKNMDKRPRQTPEGLRFVNGQWVAGPDVETEKVLQAFKIRIENKLSPKQIGPAVGRSEPTVSSWLRDHRYVKTGVISEVLYREAQKVESRNPQLENTRKQQEERELKILTLLDKGPLVDSEIARRLNLEVPNARRYIGRMRKAGRVEKDKGKSPNIITTEGHLFLKQKSLHD